jgi:hypothetical protein
MSTEDNTELTALRACGEGVHPYPARWLHVILLAVGLIGWLTFILACVGGPAWSPDSSKALFAWHDFEGGRYNVAVYDRATRKSQVIFQHLSPKDSDDDFNVVPAWQKVGTRAIVAMTTEDSDTHCTLLSIAMRGTAPPQVYDLGKKTMCMAPDLMPQIGTRMYIGTEDGITWLDLSTGETGSKTIGAETGWKDDFGLLSEHNGQLSYTRKVSRSLNDPKNESAKEYGVEFGRINLDGLDLKPKFTLWPSDAVDVDLDAFPVAWEPAGSRIAMIGAAKDTDKILMLDENKGMTGTLMPELGGVKAYRLGNLVWSHDGKTLLAPAVTKGQGEKMYDYSLAEIPLTGAPGRLTKIASFHLKNTESADQSHADQPNAEKSYLSDFDHDDLILSSSVSLSPDGSTIAATPANMDKDNRFDAPDHALFLVDMTRPTRRVTRIPYPKVPPTSAQPARSAK